MTSKGSLMGAWIFAMVFSSLAFVSACSSEKENSASFSASPAAFERKPRSMVLITVDTTRADYLEPYGSELVKTPVLQRLADRGTLMEQAYAVAPLTLPSHTSIHTGLYPLQTAVRNNGTHSVPADLSTLAERFTAAGYRSGAFVSAAVLERRYGLDQGFEIYDDDLSKSRFRLPRMVADRPAEFTVDAAVEWLGNLSDDEDFFLWVHLYDPHAVYDPPPRFREEYKTHLYAGEIAYMDEQIGRLLAHEKIETSKDIVVSVIGDHGESLGEHGENTHGILAYRSTLRVPWIIWIKGVEGGNVLKPAVSQVDLAPTLLDIAGLLDQDHGMAGQSLLGDVPRERLIYSESYLPYYTYGWSRLHVIRKGRWEYIDAPTAELYDISRDPMELSDQAVRLPEIATDLRSTLATFRDQNDATDEIEQRIEIDQQALEQLRALGYLSMETEPPAREGPRADPKEMIQFHTKLERARTFLNERLYAEAASLLEGLLERDPNNMAAMADLAHAQQRLGYLDEAADTIASALAFDPDHQQLLTMLAHVENERGNRERSIEILDQVLTKNPTNLNAWASKARTQSQTGNSNGARETLVEALEIDEQSPVLNTLYAQLVEWPDGLLVEAEQRLRLATARDPFNTSSGRVLGRLLESTGRLEEAETAYERGLEYTPDDASLHALYAVLLARRGHPDAEAHLREAIRRESEFRSELYVSLGALLAEKGRNEEAHAAYDKVLESNPSHPAARNNRAIALAQSGRIDEAKDELSALVEEQPRYGDAHNNLAVLLLKTGDAQGSERHARATLALMPSAAEAWDTLGAALLQQARTREAVEALDQALNLEPGYWSALLNRGQAKAILGEADAAREDLEAALAANNSQPDGYFALGRLLEEQLGTPGRARGYYRAFLDKFPRDPRAREVRERLSKLVALP
jgi:arylsulfatase A-like enzyme/Flp pilus assembly protein TadD